MPSHIVGPARGPAAAMAICWAAGVRPRSGAPRARRLQGDAGEDGSQGCARHCTAHAAWLLPPRALQVTAGTGGPRPADHAQAPAVEAARGRDELRGVLRCFATRSPSRDRVAKSASPFHPVAANDSDVLAPSRPSRAYRAMACRSDFPPPLTSF